ncbi:hypothetical protein CR513_13238, partial [Mucuna pruriens]
MENNNRTLKELAILDSYELKSELIHLLSKFHCLAGENPYKHLKEFHVVCSMMRPRSGKGLTVSVADHVQHVGRHETYVPRKILFGIQDCDHLEGDMWNQATLWGDTTRVLGEVQQVVCHVSSSSNQRTFLQCDKWGSVDGQNPSGNKTFDLKHGEQYAEVRDQGRSQHLKGGKRSWGNRQSKTGESTDGANIPCEATRCRSTSTKHTTSMWNLHLNGAPYRHVPHLVGERVGKH